MMMMPRVYILGCCKCIDDIKAVFGVIEPGFEPMSAAAS